MGRSWRAVALAMGILSAPPLPQAGAAETRTWQAEKCARYASAWDEVRTRYGTAGLGPDFVARHDAFLRSGCLEARDVCPRSPAEFAVADILTVAAMNAGMASTFLPFACRPARPAP